jgi:hypothetical protein
LRTSLTFFKSSYRSFMPASANTFATAFYTPATPNPPCCA